MAIAKQPRQPYHIQVRADTERAAIDLMELVRYKDLFLTLADRDIRVRYKQTALGVVWVILQPLIASLIFAFIFGVVARLPTNGKPYFLFAFAGMTAWNAFSQALTRVSSAMVWNAHMVSKIYFPRMVLPLASMASVLVDFCVSLVVLLILLVCYRIWPGPGLLLLPIWLAVLMLMASGIGLWAGAIMVKYRDVAIVLPTLVQLGLYVSPVAWSLKAVPQKYLWVFFANPLSGLLDAFRWSLIGEGTLPLWPLAYSVVITVVFVWFGASFFRQLERNFADVI